MRKEGFPRVPVDPKRNTRFQTGVRLEDKAALRGHFDLTDATVAPLERVAPRRKATIQERAEAERSLGVRAQPPSYETGEAPWPWYRAQRDEAEVRKLDAGTAVFLPTGGYGRNAFSRLDYYMLRIDGKPHLFIGQGAHDETQGQTFDWLTKQGITPPKASEWHPGWWHPPDMDEAGVYWGGSMAPDERKLFEQALGEHTPILDLMTGEPSVPGTEKRGVVWMEQPATSEAKVRKPTGYITFFYADGTLFLDPFQDFHSELAGAAEAWLQQNHFLRPEDAKKATSKGRRLQGMVRDEPGEGFIELHQDPKFLPEGFLPKLRHEFPDLPVYANAPGGEFVLRDGDWVAGTPSVSGAGLANPVPARFLPGGTVEVETDAELSAARQLGLKHLAVVPTLQPEAKERVGYTRALPRAEAIAPPTRSGSRLIRDPSDVPPPVHGSQPSPRHPADNEHDTPETERAQIPASVAFWWKRDSDLAPAAARPDGSASPATPHRGGAADWRIRTSMIETALHKRSGMDADEAAPFCETGIQAGGACGFRPLPPACDDVTRTRSALRARSP